MVPRWALRFWPDTRALGVDVIGLAPSKHGTVDVAGVCRIACLPALRQQGRQSHFITALNSYARYFDAWNQRDAAAVAACFCEGGTRPSDRRRPCGRRDRSVCKRTLRDLPQPDLRAFPCFLRRLARRHAMDYALHQYGLVFRAAADGPQRRGPRGGFHRGRRRRDTLGRGLLRLACGSEPAWPRRHRSAACDRSFCVRHRGPGQAGKRTKPGAFSITMLDTRSEDEARQVKDYSRQTAIAMLGMQGVFSALPD
jgi:hypothetical protein